MRRLDRRWQQIRYELAVLRVHVYAPMSAAVPDYFTSMSDAFESAVSSLDGSPVRKPEDMIAANSKTWSEVFQIEIGSAEHQAIIARFAEINAKLAEERKEAQ